MSHNVAAGRSDSYFLIVHKVFLPRSYSTIQLVPVGITCKSIVRVVKLLLNCFINYQIKILGILQDTILSLC